MLFANKTVHLEGISRFSGTNLFSIMTLDNVDAVLTRTCHRSRMVLLVFDGWLIAVFFKFNEIRSVTLSYDHYSVCNSENVASVTQLYPNALSVKLAKRHLADFRRECKLFE